MKKKYAFIFLFIVIALLLSLVFFFLNREYPDDENTLYSIKFGNTKLRFEKYDDALGQNQTVGVEKSTNRGKTYEKITDEPILVSKEPKFIFINKKLGFAISKSNLTKLNHYIGVKVTQDGGKTFTDGKINYDNPDIDILTIEDVPYLEDEKLKLPCSIYQVKTDQSGYEDKKLTFISIDDGLTWNLEQTNEERYTQIKSDVDKEMERYLYVVFPKCQKGNTDYTNTDELLNNAGFDKEKLLDIDYKSYCKVYVDAKCVEDGKWEWQTYLKCNNYKDDGFKNHPDEK